MQLNTLVTAFHHDSSLPPMVTVLLHYFGGSLAAWNAVTQSLCAQSPECTVVALDLRGHGDSPDAPTHSVAEMAQDVLETLGSLPQVQGLPYTLVGHSMGGKVALQIAAMQPENLHGLVLVAPSPPTPEPMSDDERAEGLAGWHDDDASRKTLEQITGISLPAADAEQFVRDRARTTQAAWNAWYEEGSKENIGSLMKKVQVPTLVLVGAKDPVIPLDVQRRETLGYLRDAFLSVVPDVGHLLPYESPEATAAHIYSSLPRFL